MEAKGKKPHKTQLEAHGVQGITGVWGDPGVAGRTNLFISINKLYYGHAKQAAAALWGTSLSSMFGKFVIVVDSDVDIILTFARSMLPLLIEPRDQRMW